MADSALAPATLGLALALCALAYYAFRIEPRWLEVSRVELTLPRLPAALDGLVLVQVSDLHAGEHTDPAFLRRAIAAVDAARPDLVVVTGDVTDHGWEIEQATSVLRELRARPAYVIFGNHDYKVGEGRPRALERALRALGMKVLRNEVATYERGGARLWVVGLDDPCTKHDDLVRALSALGPDDHPRLLLAHSPRVVAKLRPGEADLVLAGHTHGGQIFVPLLTALVLVRTYSRFSHGLYWFRGMAVYVNRGLGSLGIPARFLRRPEVTVLTLRSPAAT